MKILLAISWRVISALIVVIALGIAAISSFSEGVARSNAFSQCAILTPDAIDEGTPDDTNVDMWVEESKWPLTPICHWQAGNETETLQLLDWGYTQRVYGGQLVAAVVLVLWVGAELLLARRRRRRRLAKSSMSAS